MSDPLEEFSDMRTLVRMDPDNPVCPGCGRRDEESSFSHVILRTGALVKACPECQDDFDENREWEGFSPTLNSIHRHVKFRGVELSDEQRFIRSEA